MDQQVIAPNVVINYAAVVSPTEREAPHHRIFTLRTALAGAGMAQPLLQLRGH